MPDACVSWRGEILVTYFLCDRRFEIYSYILESAVPGPKLYQVYTHTHTYTSHLYT